MRPIRLWEKVSIRADDIVRAARRYDNRGSRLHCSPGRSCGLRLGLLWALPVA